MIVLEISNIEMLNGGDMVCVHMNDGSTEVLPIDNFLVQEYIKKKHD
jgi:hypothetical protein